MRKRIIKSAAAFTLALVMAAGLPVGVSAQEEPWARQAVEALNDVYNTSIFLADSDPFTVGTAKSFAEGILNYYGRYVNEVDKDELFAGPDGRAFTRSDACALIYAILQLPEADGGYPTFDDCRGLDDLRRDAVGRLQQLDVAGGYAEDAFGPNDTCSNAMFAALMFRALRQTGCMESRLPMFLPGEYGLFETMYLGARECLPFSAMPEEGSHGQRVLGDILNNGFSAGFDVAPDRFRDGNEGDNYYVYVQGEEEVLTAWRARLDTCVDTFAITSSGALRTVAYEPLNVGFLDAIVETVKADRARIVDPGERGLFSDVRPDHWSYNGVMYMANRGIVGGNGEGYAMLNDIAPTGTVDVFVERISGEMLGGDWANWNAGPPARRDYVAYMSAGLYGDYDEDGVSLSVLDRFRDKDGVTPAYRTALAYLVSVGAVGGTPEGDVLPDRPATRAETMVIFQRVLYGLDQTKMKDYSDAVKYALEP